MMCASAPLSPQWQVFVTMICLKWGGNDVGFGSAQPTVTGLRYNDLFKLM